MVAAQRQSGSRNKNVAAGVRDDLRQRTSRLLTRQVSFIPNAAFREMDADGVWQRELGKAQLRNFSEKVVPSRLKMPAHLERLCDTPLLSADEERGLFRTMNYLKYRANSLRSALNERRPSKKKLEQIEALLNKADAIRNEILTANTRLVVSIVKNFADEKNTFDELLSEGISSLIKAVEKFDFDRGFRFSTYATMVVRREIYRAIQRRQKTRIRFVTGQGEALNEQQHTEDVAQPSEAQLEKVDRHVAMMMDHLDVREQLIVSARYGFVDLGVKATFSNLGRKLGISKERVRQLEIRAIDKLRDLAGELGVFKELRAIASE